MAKTVFRPNELVVVPDRVMIDVPAPFITSIPVQEEEDPGFEPAAAEVYTGPTAEELRKEADDFKARWEIERKSMIQAAQAEANEIVQSADFAAENNRQNSSREAEELVSGAKAEAEKILSDARSQAQAIEEESRRKLETEQAETLERSRESGRLEGYTEGRAEVDRLIERTRTVLERAQDKRGEILAETEQEIVNLVLLISRKVVKVISENQREVIVSNVIEALRKIKDRGNVVIRVNLADLKLSTEHTKDFIKMLEGGQTVQVMEDSSVDSGGCIIETDFGEIDARISSQLAELETKILEISPLKSRVKQSAPAGGKL